MDENSKKFDIVAYIALICIIIFFSGIFSGSDNILKAFDFTTLIGNFGTTADGTNFIGRGGTGAKQGFLFAISLIPGIMFALGVVELATSYGALRAAQQLLTPFLRPLLGLPGITGLTIVSSMQSTDAGGAMTRELFLNKSITDKERTILGGFQFSAGASITNYLTTGMAVIPFLKIPILLPLGVILFYKTLGANILRLYLSFAYKEEESKENEQVTQNSQEVKKIEEVRKNPIDTFVDGLRKGWTLCTLHLLPNVVMAFILIEMLKLLGVLTFLGNIFQPVMTVFNLPGEAITVLFTTWLSGVAGAGMAASLYNAGQLTSTHIAILLPGIFLMGAQLQYMGRILAVAGVNVKYYPILFCISILNALLGMFTMRFLV